MGHDFLLVFILAHLVGDFVLQTNYIARVKAESTRGLMLHILIITAVQAVFLSIFGVIGIILGIICGIIHFGIDLLKGRIKKYLSRKQFLYFFVDQLLHLAVIWTISLAAAPEPATFAGLHTYITIAIALIIVVYISTVAAKILIRDLKSDLEKAAFFGRHERAVDALAAIAVWCICFLPTLLSIPAVIGLLFVYNKLQYRLYKYSISISCAKYVVLAFMSVFAFVVFKYI